MSTTRQRAITTHLNRRDLMRGAGLAGGAALLGGAGIMAGSGIGPASAQENVTLDFWLPGGSQTFCGMHTTVAADYTALQPTITFNEIPCGFGEENYIQQLLGAIAAGNPPDGTVLWDTPVSLAARNALVALDDWMATSQYSKVENWPAGLLASCQYGGKTYGLPVTAGVYGIWYNQELFEAKGIPSGREDFPKTWDELRALSKEFTSWNGDRLESVGFLPSPLRYTPYLLPIWSALNGSQLYDAANGVYTIDSEANIAMMDYMVAWLDEEYQGDMAKVQRSGAWQASTGDDGQPPAFQSGRLAATEDGSWLMGDFYAYIEPTFTNWNLASFPVGPGGTAPVSGYWPNWVVIPEGSDNPAEMFGYLDYLGGVGVEKWFATVPDIPTNTLVSDDLVPQVLIDKRGPEVAVDVMAFWKEQAAISTSMWNSPVESFASDQLRVALEEIAFKKVTPKDGLATAQKACQAELEKVLAG